MGGVGWGGGSFRTFTPVNEICYLTFGVTVSTVKQFILGSCSSLAIVLYVQLHDPDWNDKVHTSLSQRQHTHT